MDRPSTGIAAPRRAAITVIPGITATAVSRGENWRERSAACPRLLDFRIQLGAAEDNERRHIEPHQQDDDRADRAIRLVVRAESRDVERETGRADQPQQCCRDRASAEAMPSRLSPGRRIAVEGGE